MSYHLGIIFVGGTLSIAEIVSLFYRNRFRPCLAESGWSNEYTAGNPFIAVYDNYDLY